MDVSEWRPGTGWGHDGHLSGRRYGFCVRQHCHGDVFSKERQFELPGMSREDCFKNRLCLVFTRRAASFPRWGVHGAQTDTLKRRLDAVNHPSYLDILGIVGYADH